MEDFEKELKEDFLEESLQLLEDCEQSFLTLEDSKDDAELLDQIFRLAHNLKGTSRAVGFGDVAEFTHEMENLILKLKTNEIEVSDYVVTVLLECNDYLTHMITSLRQDMDGVFKNPELISKIIDVINGDVQEVSSSAEDEDEDEAYEILSAAENEDWEDEAKAEIEINKEELAAAEIDLQAVSFEDKEIAAVDESLTEADFDKEFENLLSGTDPVKPKAVSTEITSSNEPEISLAAIEALKELGVCDENLLQELESAAAKSEDVLNFKKGDEVLPVDKVEAVEKPVTKKAPIEKDIKEVVALAKTAEKKEAPKKAEDESIRVSLSRVEKLNNFVGELVILQTVLEQRRHVAITDDLSNKSISQLAKLSKEIQEISMSLRMIPIKSTLQKMSRIVRDTSKALDKNVKLTLGGEETEIDKTVLEHLADPLVHIIRNAVDHGLESTQGRIDAGKSEQGNVSLNAFHEGNNLVIEVKDDGNGIKSEVIRAKAIEKGIMSEDSKLTDDEIVQFIFHPGFSTKEEVTEVSGRGVGMDVVKTNIEKLSGSVVVKTEVGVGSTFRVVLPLTLAIIDGMVVRIGEEKYIIPLNQVHESLKPTKEMLNVISGVGEVLNLRGGVIPLFNIAKTLKRKTDDKDTCSKIAIIVHTDKYNFAVIVDDILHQQQVVIKKLGAEIRDNKGFMGSSILGDGKPSFILDLNELYRAKASKAQNIKKPIRANKAA